MVRILGIESSCDDTSAAVFCDKTMLSNIIANQKVHEKYGGVIPELASRVHQQNIVPVVDIALKEAGVEKNDLDAIACTRGPGLMGSLLVGVSFAKGLAASLNIPLIEVNHLQGHVLSHFIEEKNGSKPAPSLPFLCLLASGGHTQIIIVKDHLDFEIIGETVDDAAGEAFDKCAKIMELPYPGGPAIDFLAKTGNPDAFVFAKPKVSDLNYSFSGLKTSFLYFLQKNVAENPAFVELNRADLCASLQKTIIAILFDKLTAAAKKTGIRDIAIAGGVSANSGLREHFRKTGERLNWNVFIPERKFTTDNAAMIAITGYFKYCKSLFSGLDITPLAKMN
ncbi:MAG: tRNA (adenosine(37)-N6)-threonylcarbamoyltransferase complex transferase subunit TsaD [Prevotellaceae bacterium]|jgi:N6-L-threonylcarbamoyladenine synthase|nr:tRNA (adenosine(37)-N6)-threonylcarbamoyltransferase complex transferase subunit TsaD [Prevotellaceae bacterium]